MNELFGWLNQQLNERNLKGHVYEQTTTQEGRWYYVPLYIDMRDAYDKAKLMQSIEADWEKQNVQPGTRLQLMPAAPTAKTAA